MATDRAYAGLCADCQYARIISSERRSVFYVCGRASSDPQFPKYPPLPVLQCHGYALKEQDYQARLPVEP